MAKLTKTRDDIGTPGVAQNRFEILKEVIGRYNKCMENEYYLEAISLCESLITDRMESRLGELRNNIVEFDTLSNLRNQLLGNKVYPKLEINSTLERLYNEICNKWAGQRNKAIHQSAKISRASPKVWKDFLKDAKKTADDGMKYFRALDRELKKLRK